jgi:hypothetical protein
MARRHVVRDGRVLVVAQAAWDPTFSEHSYGFRRGRSAHQAVKQAHSCAAIRSPMWKTSMVLAVRWASTSARAKR